LSTTSRLTPWSGGQAIARGSVPRVTNPLCVLSLDELRRRTSMKWRRFGADVLPLWVAEMDVPLADAVVRAVDHAIAIGDTGYPEGTAYAEAFADFARERWGWEIDIDASANVPDVMGGIVEILKLVTRRGDAVVVNSPVYTPFYRVSEQMERRVIEAPLNAEHRIDSQTLDEAFAAATAGGRSAAFLLCSPHNPTGTVHSREELATVVAHAQRHGVRVLADEIHAPIVAAGNEHVPYLTMPGSERAFCLLSASKAWNLAGLKAALAVAGPEAAVELSAMPEAVRHGPSHVGVIAHVAALRGGRRWLDSLLLGLDANCRLLGDLLAEHLPAVRYRCPQGTYLAWLDCRALQLGDDPAAVFLERGRVALSSGPRFGTGGAGYVRLNLATSPDILRDAVGRMASALR
jgi:cystathionine beta-lyase